MSEQKLDVHQQPYWGSTMQLVQGENTVHLYENDVARIVAERYGLKEFTTSDLVDALINRDIWPTPSPEYILCRVSQTITEMVKLGNSANWNEPISENFATVINELKAWREEYANELSVLAELAGVGKGEHTKVLIREGGG